MDTEIIREEDEDLEGNSIYHEYKQHSVKVQVGEIDYKSILQGIGNYEQGREPSIGQRIYFISLEKNIIFNMYDDRGCIVYSSDPQNIKSLYKSFNGWIVDFNRGYIDSIFKSL